MCDSKACSCTSGVARAVAIAATSLLDLAMRSGLARKPSVEQPQRQQDDLYDKSPCYLIND